MRHILIAEISQRGQDRVRSCLAEAAECVVFDIFCEMLQTVQILQFALTFSDAVQDLVHALCADTARCTLTTGFIDCELQEEFRNVDHAVVFVHDDQTAGTHHGTDGDQVVIVNRDVIVLSRDAAAGRTAGLRRFELLAVRDAAADVFDDLAQGRSHRDLHQTGVVDLAAEGEDLGALGFLGTHGSKPVGPVQNDLRNVCPGLDVVQDRRTLEQTGDSRERRTGTRLTALAFDGGHQGCFFAADKSAGAETQLDIEVESGVKDVVAEQTIFLRLLDRDAETLDSDRIFGTDVDVTLVGADRVAGDRHGFENRVRITFQNGTVHECTRVAFVGVTADILGTAVLHQVSGQFPFLSGREARAAAAAEAGSQNGIDDLIRCHFGQNFAQGFIAAGADVFIDVFRIDHAAVAQRDTGLFLVKVCIIQRFASGGLVFFSVDQTLDRTARQQVLGNDFRNIFCLHLCIVGCFGINDNDRTQCAETVTACLDDRNLFVESFLFNILFERLDNLGTSGRSADGSAADQYM